MSYKIEWLWINCTNQVARINGHLFIERDAFEQIEVRNFDHEVKFPFCY